MRRRALLVLGAGALAALGGCAAPRLAPTPQPASVELAGRLSLVSGVAEAQKALYGGFRLVLQGQDAGEFEVFSPLGQMLARAQWSPGQASLDYGRQRQHYASFDAMTRAALGVALPQAALQDWVRGKPAADLPAQDLPGGAFVQLGWTVRPVWRDGRLALLQAQRDGADPAQLRMVIDAASGAAAR